MKWVKRISLALGAVVLLLVAVIFGGSEWVLRRSHAAPLTEIAVPKDAASIAEGGRLAKALGCRGCHGPDGEGREFIKEPMLATVYTPAFARIVPGYTDAELVRLVRHGVRKDGRGLFIMPTASYAHLADADLGKIIAWLRTLKPSDKDELHQTSFGPMGRALVLGGMLTMNVVPGSASPPAQRPAAVGQYYADAICSACHQLHKESVSPEGLKVPALAPMAAAYDDAAFQRLITTGQGMTPRNLGLMAEVAKNDFSAFTPGEIAAIHAYLKEEAAKAPPE